MSAADPIYLEEQGLQIGGREFLRQDGCKSGDASLALDSLDDLIHRLFYLFINIKCLLKPPFPAGMVPNSTRIACYTILSVAAKRVGSGGDAAWSKII